MPTILCHHTHTADSNRAEREVRGHTNGIHHADYVSTVGAAPPNLDVIFTRTEHWQADPARFDRLAERVAARDGAVDRFDSHVVFEVGGSRGAVINGVETSVETDDSHVTVCGLPIEDRPPARACSLDELCALAREAAWVAPAHPLFPGLGFPDERLRRFLERVEGEPFGVALGYTTGYPAALNALARGRHTARPIRAYAREYDVPLLPELDWHAPLPRTPSGFGVVDDEAFAALVEGEIPTADLLNSRVLKAGRWPGGVAWTDFVQTFPGAVPAPFRSFAGTATPTPDRLRAVRDRTTAELFAHSFWRRFCRSA
ncbi:hypothetical protein CK500_02540 [Halorubrum salipaludis]|uniref:Uncharacterized protein n=1 Tax=Halorubrum salipaludis TaxID=2032630 RepID=A0A2A2FJC3_9EURY|nr:hypothetical protein [Halorubrum salipaludis]PAU85566.1 hypothetical protein CK500_02540 [Halorubrum salipaludis]